MDCERVRDMLDAYVLGASDVADVAVVEEHIADCVRCWDELSRGQQTAALIALTVPIQQAPPKLGQRIISQAQRERGPRIEPKASFWQRLRTWPAAAGALGVASVVALGVSGFLGMQVQDLHDQNDQLQNQLASNTAALQLQLNEASKQLDDQRAISSVLSDGNHEQITVKAPGGTGIAEAYYTWSPDTHLGFMICENLPALDDGQVYQVWVVTENNSSVPVVPFQSTDGTCQVTMDFPSFQLDERPTGIGITIESAPGGSVEPSGPYLVYAHF